MSKIPYDHKINSAELTDYVDDEDGDDGEP